jgi:glutaconate CoA-transferase subunit B
MRPHPETNEFMVTSLHPGVSRERIRENTGWPVRFFDEVKETAPPSIDELGALRDLNARTRRAHGDNGSE